MRGEGETLARHEKILLDLAKRQNLCIGKIYREIVSGETIKARPEMQQLLVDLENRKWEGVLVTEVERLTRGSAKDQGIIAEAFTYPRTFIVTPSRIYDPSNESDAEYLEFGFFMSRREFTTGARRMRAGKTQSVKEGNYIGTYAPYGYRKIKVKSKPTLEPHPEQTQVVQMIYDMSIQGQGCYSIASKLNELNIPASRTMWDRWSVYGVLTNPIYIGKVRLGRNITSKKIIDGDLTKTRKKSNDFEVFDGKHRPIVDNEIFDKVQELLGERNTAPVKKGYAMKNPLSGLVICSSCGKTMVRHTQTGNKRDRLVCQQSYCKITGAMLHVVEEGVIKALGEYLKSLEVETVETREDNTDILIDTLERTRKEIEELKFRKNKLHDFLESGVYTPDVFLERSKIIEMDLLKKKESVKNIELEIKDAKVGIDKDVIPQIRTIIETYYELDVDKKNELLKGVIGRIEYKRDSPKDNIELNVQPRFKV